MPSPLETEQLILNSVYGTSAGTGALRVSTITADTAFSLDPDASNNRVSAIQSGANLLRVSDIQGDAGLLRVSDVQGDASLLRISAIQDGGAALNVSAKSNDGGLLRVSDIQGDASLLRTSSMLFGNTTGALTITTNLNVSTSFNAKSAAGALYGWHAWNSDTKPNYIKLTNTSGAINTGVDVPILTISLAASGRSDAFYPLGLKGFTAGIGAYSVSVVLDNANTAGTASAVGIDLYYI